MWTKPGAGKPSTVRSAITAPDDDGGSNGICIDDGPKAEEEAEAAEAAVAAADLAPPAGAGAASCELYSSVTSVKAGKATVGGVYPSGPPTPLC